MLESFQLLRFDLDIFLSRDFPFPAFALRHPPAAGTARRFRREACDLFGVRPAQCIVLQRNATFQIGFDILLLIMQSIRWHRLAQSAVKKSPERVAEVISIVLSRPELTSGLS
jgi:hypothetical protein